MVFIMMFMVLGVTIILFSITPQYVQYGNQVYQHHYTAGNETKTETKSCATDAPQGTVVLTFLFS